MEDQINISELLLSIKVICQERNLDDATVRGAIEEALATTLKRFRRKEEREYRVVLDEKEASDKDGKAISAYRRWRILDEEEPMSSPEHEIMLDLAREKNPEFQPGDYLEEEIDKEEIAQRMNAQTARQLIQQRLRDVEKSKVLEEFLERGEDLVHATIRKVDHSTGDAICESYGVECTLRKEDQIPRESIRTGDRLRAMVKEINREGRVPRLYVTRANVDFLKKLFEREVPEIENGVLEIVNAVREPGHRAKVAVRSHDPKVDPVGTCVGIRGSRVQSVTNELNGERIDIIPWHEKPEEYVMRAISPADIIEIVVNGDDEKAREMTLIVAEDKISSTIGRNGSNVRLASELTGWRLNVSTQEKRRGEDQEHMEKVTSIFMNRLDIDNYAAEMLFYEGFESIEVVALTGRGDMLSIEGFTEEFVDKLQQRAQLVTEEDDALINKRLAEMDPKLSELEDMDDELLRILAREEILTLDDLGDLANDELIEMTNIRDEERVNRLIMSARAPILEI